ncbi:MAG: DUF4136 domain-containing protein [Sulfurifustaceae bacterium]
MKNTMLVLAIGFGLVGCATPLAMNVDYDKAANFGALKTYDWMPPTGNAAANDLLVKRIKGSVDSQLQTKGRTMTTDNPDFLIAMQLSGKTTYGGSVGAGVSVGIPVGRAGSISVGGGKSAPREKKEGTVILEFVDPKTKSLLWRGTASGAVNPAATPEQQQQRIDEVVGKMLAQFPPGKK